MIDKKQRAHDIAISILPNVLKENKQEYYTFDENGVGTFNASEIAEEYWSIYEALLKQLPDQGGL